MCHIKEFTLPTSCRVLDEVPLTKVAAGCNISALEVEVLAILFSLAGTFVARYVPIAFIMSLRVGSDSSSVTKTSSDDAGSD